MSKHLGSGFGAYISCICCICVPRVSFRQCVWTEAKHTVVRCKPSSQNPAFGIESDGNKDGDKEDGQSLRDVVDGPEDILRMSQVRDNALRRRSSTGKAHGRQLFMTFAAERTKFDTCEETLLERNPVFAEGGGKQLSDDRLMQAYARASPLKWSATRQWRERVRGKKGMET